MRIRSYAIIDTDHRDYNDESYASADLEADRSAIVANRAGGRSRRGIRTPMRLAMVGASTLALQFASSFAAAQGAPDDERFKLLCQLGLGPNKPPIQKIIAVDLGARVIDGHRAAITDNDFSWEYAEKGMNYSWRINRYTGGVFVTIKKGSGDPSPDYASGSCALATDRRF